MPAASVTQRYWSALVKCWGSCTLQNCVLVLSPTTLFLGSCLYPGWSHISIPRLHLRHGQCRHVANQIEHSHSPLWMTWTWHCWEQVGGRAFLQREMSHRFITFPWLSQYRLYWNQDPLAISWKKLEDIEVSTSGKVSFTVPNFLAHAGTISTYHMQDKSLWL